MKIVRKQSLTNGEIAPIRLRNLIPGIVGLGALAATFAISISDIDIVYKIAACFAVAAGYFAAHVFSFFRAEEHGETTIPVDASRALQESDDIHSKLRALEDANQFFGASLKPADMFLLVSKRTSWIYPFSVCTLFVANQGASGVRAVQTDGSPAPDLSDFAASVHTELAERAIASGNIEIVNGIDFFHGGRFENLRSSAAIPLFDGGSIFAVYQLYTILEISADETTISTLEAIGERIAPIFQSSMAFEQSLSKALTDTLTDLPNERAFFMILENQLAESQRYRDERPITVLAIDIKNFSDANSNFGHATGDRVLVFAAGLLKDHLRKMDFLVRSINDEFVVILPTATEQTALDIVERIKANFAAKPFQISEKDSIKLWLNFGWATFWKDGETAQQLLQNAQLRKQQSKSGEPSKVLWFPKEYVN